MRIIFWYPKFLNSLFENSWPPNIDLWTWKVFVSSGLGAHTHTHTHTHTPHTHTHHTHIYIYNSSPSIVYNLQTATLVMLWHLPLHLREKTVSATIGGVGMLFSPRGLNSLDSIEVTLPRIMGATCYADPCTTLVFSSVPSMPVMNRISWQAIFP